jgi:hypothetical protein
LGSFAPSFEPAEGPFQASDRSWQNGHITVEPSLPPLDLVLETQKSVIFIPDMRELNGGHLGRGFGPALLPTIFQAGANLLSETPVESRFKISRLLRQVVERCETIETQ